MTLETYLKQGGLLSNFPLETAHTTYSDKNDTKDITNIIFDGYNHYNKSLYLVTFKDQTKQRYHGMFIQAYINITINVSYTK